MNGVFYSLQNAWIKHLRPDFAMYVGFSSFEFKNFEQIYQTLSGSDYYILWPQVQETPFQLIHLNATFHFSVDCHISYTHKPHVSVLHAGKIILFPL